MLENANHDIRRSRLEAARRRAASERLMRLVHAIDDVLWDLEELNLRGVDRVPSRVRDRVGQILEVVHPVAQGPEDELRVRYRVLPMMDVLYQAQEVLFRLRDPSRPLEHEGAEDQLLA